MFLAIELNEGSDEREVVDPCSHFMQSPFGIQFIVQQLQSDSDSLFLTEPYDPSDISPHLTTTARLRTGPITLFLYTVSNINHQSLFDCLTRPSTEHFGEKTQLIKIPASIVITDDGAITEQMHERTDLWKTNNQ